MERPCGRLLALVLAGLVVVALAVADGAAASTTHTEVISVHETDPFADGLIFCGFPLELRSDGSFKVTTHLDNTGTPTKMIATPFGGPFTVTLRNPATGKSATTTSQALVGVQTVNPDGSTSESDTGVTFNFTVPGLGSIFKVSGRVTFTADGTVTFVAGPHPIITPAMCTYMATP